MSTNSTDITLGGDGHTFDHTMQTVLFAPESQLQWLVPLPAVQRLGHISELELQITINLEKRFPVNDGSFETIVYPHTTRIPLDEVCSTVCPQLFALN